MLIIVLLCVIGVYWGLSLVTCLRELNECGFFFDSEIRPSVRIFAVACCIVPILNGVVVFVANLEKGIEFKINVKFQRQPES